MMVATAAPSAEPIELDARGLEAREDRINVDVCLQANWGSCTSIAVYTQHDCCSWLHPS